MKELKDYYVYILRCKDNSLYTGITTDIERRYKEHIEGVGAKYTRSKGVLNIESLFQCQGKKEASRIEYYIKKLSKKNKEFFINNLELFLLKIKEDLDIEIKNINFKKSIDMK